MFAKTTADTDRLLCNTRRGNRILTESVGKEKAQVDDHGDQMTAESFFAARTVTILVPRKITAGCRPPHATSLELRKTLQHLVRWLSNPPARGKTLPPRASIRSKRFPMTSLKKAPFDFPAQPLHVPAAAVVPEPKPAPELCSAPRLIGARKLMCISAWRR